MTPLPLRTTLTLLYAAVLSVILTAVGWGDHAALKRQLDTSVTADLEDKARALHGYLRFAPNRVDLAVDPGDAEEAAFIADATRYYQVYDGTTGRLLRQSPGLESLGLNYTITEVGEFRGSPGVRDVQTDRGRLRLTSTVITAPDGDVYLVQVGALLDRLDASLAAFDRALAIRTALGVVIAALMGFAFSGLALGPLRRLTRQATAIDITNLQARLPVRGAGDELDQLAQAFNDALARLERSVNEMRQFSAALAHELRTPLAILRGEAEVALAAQPAESARERLASQLDEYDRLTRLINQILMLARAESGELSIARSRVDLSALALQVAEQVEPLAEAKGLTLVRRIDPALYATIDAGWIERLLLILIDNAINFTPAGGQVTVGVQDSEGGVTLGVSDTGAGIGADALPRIFEPFYRGDPGTRRSDGAGIGLALAKWIVDAHRAHIGVTSVPNSGTTFSVIFPAT